MDMKDNGQESMDDVGSPVELHRDPVDADEDFYMAPNLEPTWQDVVLNYPTGLFIALGVGGGLLLSIMIVLCCICCHNRRLKENEERKLLDVAIKRDTTKKKILPKTMYVRDHSRYIVRRYEPEEQAHMDRPDTMPAVTEDEVMYQYELCELSDNESHTESGYAGSWTQHQGYSLPLFEPLGPHRSHFPCERTQYCQHPEYTKHKATIEGHQHGQTPYYYPCPMMLVAPHQWSPHLPSSRPRQATFTTPSLPEPPPSPPPPPPPSPPQSSPRFSQLQSPRPPSARPPSPGSPSPRPPSPRQPSPRLPSQRPPSPRLPSPRPPSPRPPPSPQPMPSHHVTRTSSTSFKPCPYHTSSESQPSRFSDSSVSSGVQVQGKISRNASRPSSLQKHPRVKGSFPSQTREREQLEQRLDSQTAGARSCSHLRIFQSYESPPPPAEPAIPRARSSPAMEHIPTRRESPHQWPAHRKQKLSMIVCPSESHTSSSDHLPTPSFEKEPVHPSHSGRVLPQDRSGIISRTSCTTALQPERENVESISAYEHTDSSAQIPERMWRGVEDGQQRSKVRLTTKSPVQTDNVEARLNTSNAVSGLRADRVQQETKNSPSVSKVSTTQVAEKGHVGRQKSLSTHAFVSSQACSIPKCSCSLKNIEDSVIDPSNMKRQQTAQNDKDLFVVPPQMSRAGGEESCSYTGSACTQNTDLHPQYNASRHSTAQAVPVEQIKTSDSFDAHVYRDAQHTNDRQFAAQGSAADQVVNNPTTLTSQSNTDSQQTVTQNRKCFQTKGSACHKSESAYPVVCEHGFLPDSEIQQPSSSRVFSCHDCKHDQHATAVSSSPQHMQDHHMSSPTLPAQCYSFPQNARPFHHARHKPNARHDTENKRVYPESRERSDVSVHGSVALGSSFYCTESPSPGSSIGAYMDEDFYRFSRDTFVPNSVSHPHCSGAVHTSHELHASLHPYHPQVNLSSHTSSTLRSCCHSPCLAHTVPRREEKAVVTDVNDSNPSPHTYEVSMGGLEKFRKNEDSSAEHKTEYMKSSTHTANPAISRSQDAKSCPHKENHVTNRLDSLKNCSHRRNDVTKRPESLKNCTHYETLVTSPSPSPDVLDNFSNLDNSQSYTTEADEYSNSSARGVTSKFRRNYAQHNISRTASGASLTPCAGYDSLRAVEIENPLTDSMTVHVEKYRSGRSQSKDKVHTVSTRKAGSGTGHVQAVSRSLTAHVNYMDTDSRKRPSQCERSAKRLKLQKPSTGSVKINISKSETQAMMARSRKKQRQYKEEEGNCEKYYSDRNTSSLHKRDSGMNTKQIPLINPRLNYKHYFNQIKTSSYAPVQKDSSHKRTETSSPVKGRVKNQNYYAKVKDMFPNDKMKHCKHFTGKYHQHSDSSATKKWRQHSGHNPQDPKLREQLSSRALPTSKSRSRNVYFQTGEKNVSKARKKYGEPAKTYSKLPFPRYPYYPYLSPSSPERTEPDIRRNVQIHKKKWTPKQTKKPKISKLQKQISQRSHSFPPFSPSSSPPRKKGKNEVMQSTKIPFFSRPHSSPSQYSRTKSEFIADGAISESDRHIRQHSGRVLALRRAYNSLSSMSGRSPSPTYPYYPRSPSTSPSPPRKKQAQVHSPGVTSESESEYESPPAGRVSHLRRIFSNHWRQANKYTFPRYRHYGEKSTRSLRKDARRDWEEASHISSDFPLINAESPQGKVFTLRKIFSNRSMHDQKLPIPEYPFSPCPRSPSLEYKDKISSRTKLRHMQKTSREHNYPYLMGSSPQIYQNKDTHLREYHRKWSPSTHSSKKNTQSGMKNQYPFLPCITASPQKDYGLQRTFPVHHYPYFPYRSVPMGLAGNDYHPCFPSVQNYSPHCSCKDHRTNAHYVQTFSPCPVGTCMEHAHYVHSSRRSSEKLAPDEGRARRALARYGRRAEIYSKLPFPRYPYYPRTPPSSPPMKLVDDVSNSAGSDSEWDYRSPPERKVTKLRKKFMESPRSSYRRYYYTHKRSNQSQHQRNSTVSPRRSQPQVEEDEEETRPSVIDKLFRRKSPKPCKDKVKGLRKELMQQGVRLTGRMAPPHVESSLLSVNQSSAKLIKKRKSQAQPDQDQNVISKEDMHTQPSTHRRFSQKGHSTLQRQISDRYGVSQENSASRLTSREIISGDIRKHSGHGKRESLTTRRHSGETEHTGLRRRSGKGEPFTGRRESSGSRRHSSRMDHNETQRLSSKEVNTDLHRHSMKADTLRSRNDLVHAHDHSNRKESLALKKHSVAQSDRIPSRCSHDKQSTLHRRRSSNVGSVISQRHAGKTDQDGVRRTSHGGQHISQRQSSERAASRRSLAPQERSSKRGNTSSLWNSGKEISWDRPRHSSHDRRQSQVSQRHSNKTEHNDLRWHSSKGKTFADRRNSHDQERRLSGRHSSDKRPVVSQRPSSKIDRETKHRSTTKREADVSQRHSGEKVVSKRSLAPLGRDNITSHYNSNEGVRKDTQKLSNHNRRKSVVTPEHSYDIDYDRLREHLYKKE